MMNDKELEKIMKKSSRKQTGKVVLGSTFLVLIILFITFLGYTNHFNKWPFDKEKIAGIPNNTIQKHPDSNSLGNLLLSPQETTQFNMKANQVRLYLEHYEGSELVDTKEVATLSGNTADDDNLYGSIQWGMLDWGETDDNLRVALTVGKTSTQSSLTLKAKDQIKNSIGVNNGMDYDSYKLEKDIPYLMAFWGIGADTITTAEFSNHELNADDL